MSLLDHRDRLFPFKITARIADQLRSGVTKIIRMYNLLYMLEMSVTPHDISNSHG